MTHLASHRSPRILLASCTLWLIACGSTPVGGLPDASPDADAHPDGTAADTPGSVDAIAETPQEGPAADVGNDIPGASDAPGSDRGDATSGSDAKCGSLANTAVPITPTMIGSITPNFVGGAVKDGIYELVRAEETISSAPAKFWRTFQIRNGGTEFEWVIQDVGLPPEHHFVGTMKVVGTTLVMTDRCEGPTFTYPYDAPGNELTIYFAVGQTGGRIFHYRARP